MDKETFSNFAAWAKGGIILLTPPSVWYIYLVLFKDEVSPFLKYYMPYVCGIWVLCMVARKLFNKQIEKIKKEDALFFQKKRDIAEKIALEEKKLADHFAKVAKEGERKRAAQKTEEERIKLENERRKLAEHHKEMLAIKAKQLEEEHKKEKAREAFLKSLNISDN